MADASDGPRPFDVRTIRYLVRLMREHDLGEIDLREGDRRICLRRAVAPAAAPAPAAPAHAAPAAPAAPAPAATAAPEKDARKLHEVKSSLVGTFYAQRKPGEPPFVTAGSKVRPGDPLCIIMAMKVENVIDADVAGTVVEVCVKNEDFVEYNTVLFRVDPGA
jgi:acetyl-CoA carboxylase biotin carboxyl carrier protein